MVVPLPLSCGTSTTSNSPHAFRTSRHETKASVEPLRRVVLRVEMSDQRSTSIGVEQRCSGDLPEVMNELIPAVDQPFQPLLGGLSTGRVPFDRLEERLRQVTKRLALHLLPVLETTILAVRASFGMHVRQQVLEPALDLLKCEDVAANPSQDLMNEATMLLLDRLHDGNSLAEAFG
jgi:hypothetical protein